MNTIVVDVHVLNFHTIYCWWWDLVYILVINV